MAAADGVKGLLKALGDVIEGVPVLKLLGARRPGHLPARVSSMGRPAGASWALRLV